MSVPLAPKNSHPLLFCVELEFIKHSSLTIFVYHQSVIIRKSFTFKQKKNKIKSIFFGAVSLMCIHKILIGPNGAHLGYHFLRCDFTTSIQFVNKSIIFFNIIPYSIYYTFHNIILIVTDIDISRITLVLNSYWSNLKPLQL